jgi:hypothetical protein
MGNLYEAIKDYIETWDRCNKCNRPTCDSKIQEFNRICENCYYGDYDSLEDK